MESGVADEISRRAMPYMGSIKSKQMKLRKDGASPEPIQSGANSGSPGRDMPETGVQRPDRTRLLSRGAAPE